MNSIIYITFGVLIPLLGTTLGSAFVFFLKNKMNEEFQKLIIGLASGVMIAASIWSLIIPSIDMAEKQGIISFIPPSFGFILGILFLIVINKIYKKVEDNMLIFSVTLHNIPEGMAVGVCFAGFLSGEIPLLVALTLSLGIAIQNIPEGTIISTPLKLKGLTKLKSFTYGFLSGVVEPIASIITILLLNLVVPILPYLLSFAAGAMIYVVVEELIPEIHIGKKTNSGIIGLSIGFIAMMILDITLG